ncbi:MAG: Hint domain-containing protein, partial [Pirellula sp.]
GNFMPGPSAIAKPGTALWKAYNKFDDLGDCASTFTKLVHGGCFVAGTKVTVSELPYSASRESTLWSETDWISNNEYSFSPSPLYSFGSEKFEFQSVNLKSQASSLKPARQIPIEQVPLGARVPTKNPNRYEVDPQPEPNQATWAKLSITVKRSDGGIVDAELIRPRAWIRSVGIEAGKLLPINIEELQVKGSATVTSIDDCPEIADGEGSVVTARFTTREVHVVASVDIQGPDGFIETITGTPIHPIWSVDRQEWVPLGELTEGETLQGFDGLAIVLGLSLTTVAKPVYNIEVHGEHVYQVGELGLLVHNSCIQPGTQAWENAVKAIANARKGVKPNFEVASATSAKQLLKEALGDMNQYNNYAHDVLNYSKGFEIHNVMNARELTVHSLQHLKWYANKTSGHIFYKTPN